MYLINPQLKLLCFVSVFCPFSGFIENRKHTLAKPSYKISLSNNLGDSRYLHGHPTTKASHVLSQFPALFQDSKRTGNTP
jgi:hypothetical protein